MESENQILPVDETQTSTELDIASRINALHAKAEALSKLAKDKAQEAIKVAIECGRLLVGQKKVIAYGDWSDWVTTNCHFTRMTAHRYIKLYSAIQHSSETKPVVTPVLQLNEDTGNEVSEEAQTNNFIESLPAKTLKDAYIATGIIPPRKKPELKQDDTPQTYKVEHVKFIDDFVKWYHDFKEKYPPEEMTESTVDALLLDLSAVVRIYQELAAIKKSRFHD